MKIKKWRFKPTGVCYAHEYNTHKTHISVIFISCIVLPAIRRSCKSPSQNVHGTLHFLWSGSLRIWKSNGGATVELCVDEWSNFTISRLHYIFVMNRNSIWIFADQKIVFMKIYFLLIVCSKFILVFKISKTIVEPNIACVPNIWIATSNNLLIFWHVSHIT